ncbi:MAG: NADH-quinone oxidoreductase subunit A [Deferrisomatales bacterium]|nr:NADH-quinone oxidoreductase subunit A [Deferrisomatales bacterium]
MLQNYVPILILFLLATAFGLGVVLISTFLGPRRPNADKLATYECGMVVEPGGRRAFDIKYYLVAMEFLVFDLEVAFLYPWAVRFRHLGPEAFVGMMVFLFVLVVGFAYTWRKGVLQWE